MNIDTSN